MLSCSPQPIITVVVSPSDSSPPRPSLSSFFSCSLSYFSSGVFRHHSIRLSGPARGILQLAGGAALVGLPPPPLHERARFIGPLAGQETTSSSVHDLQTALALQRALREKGATPLRGSTPWKGGQLWHLARRRDSGELVHCFRVALPRGDWAHRFVQACFFCLEWQPLVGTRQHEHAQLTQLDSRRGEGNPFELQHVGGRGSGKSKKNHMRRCNDKTKKCLNLHNG